MSTALTDRRSRFLPWHSAAAGWAVTVAVLVYAIPLFLCMPPWNDVTLHDMAVRAMLHGGVHYRDVFDTNLPGIDWAMAGVRRIFGRSYEALRAVDLVVIGAAAAVLLVWVRRAGGTGYCAAWLAAAFALFYPFTSEFNHVQRDPWLLLPAVLAASMRASRTIRGMGQAPPTPSGRVWRSVVEGLVWGAAVWVKPHVLIPALTVWGVSVLLMARRETARQILLDLGGLLAGGLAAGAAGVAWLIATGAWPYFLDVFLNWNPSYLEDVWGSMGSRFLRTFYCFRPWSILHVPALAFAGLALWEMWAWSRNAAPPPSLSRWPWAYSTSSTEPVAVSRALLAAFYLAWFVQATVLQKGLDYVQIPLMLLAMAMVATQRWAIGFGYLIWFMGMSLLVNWTAMAPVARAIEPVLEEVRGYNDPLAEPEVLRLWTRCWQEGGSPELRDRLGIFTDIHCGTNWENLEAVAEYLRTVTPPLGPGELNCWHDSTHPLYLILDLEPATRYMHYGTAFGIRKQGDRIASEVAASRQRYVVSDLLRMTWRKEEAYAPGPGGDPRRLPCWFPVSQRGAFPWNQPIVFRAGRYMVHKVENPPGAIDVPDWNTLDQLGPGDCK